MDGDVWSEPHGAWRPGSCATAGPDATPPTRAPSRRPFAAGRRCNSRPKRCTSELNESAFVPRGAWCAVRRWRAAALAPEPPHTMVDLLL